MTILINGAWKDVATEYQTRWRISTHFLMIAKKVEDARQVLFEKIQADVRQLALRVDDLVSRPNFTATINAFVHGENTQTKKENVSGLMSVKKLPAHLQWSTLNVHRNANLLAQRTDTFVTTVAILTIVACVHRVWFFSVKATEHVSRKKIVQSVKETPSLRTAPLHVLSRAWEMTIRAIVHLSNV